MPRDRFIRHAFEIADDGIQGVFGYYMYGIACRRSANETNLIAALPPNQFPITHEWDRIYNPLELHQAMTKYFDAYHARVSLISIIGIFEGCLQNFIARLINTQKIGKSPQGTYKGRLHWTFGIVAQSTYGSQTMHARIPDLCLDVDHSRRIRNLWMHNNGLFDNGYADAVQVAGGVPIYDPAFKTYQADNRRKIPFLLSWQDFFSMYRSHIELLHHLHDTVQRTYFGQKRPYGYASLKKRIEWHRLLIGK